MWGFPCAQGIKWRWNVYFGSSLLLWSNSFSLYSLPFYILNLLLFSISYHHNYYGHMSCLFYTRLILFTALLLCLFADLSCQISLMPSTLSLPQAQGGMVSEKTLSCVRTKMIKIWKLNTWFNFEQPDTLEHQTDIYVCQSNWPIFICFGWKEESLFLFVVLLDIYRESETQSLQSHVYFKIFPVL